MANSFQHRNMEKKHGSQGINKKNHVKQGPCEILHRNWDGTYGHSSSHPDLIAISSLRLPSSFDADSQEWISQVPMSGKHLMISDVCNPHFLPWRRIVMFAAENPWKSHRFCSLSATVGIPSVGNNSHPVKQIVSPMNREYFCKQSTDWFSIFIMSFSYPY